jgi:molecular chaperone DnaK
MALQRLREAAEKAKCELSTSTTAEINLPFITADQTGPKHLTMSLTRAKFEQLVTKLVEEARKPCVLAMKDAKITPQEIDEVILVGGTTRSPIVQKLVKEVFKKEPNRSVNPDEVVALGAAIQGAVLAGEVHDVLLLDVTPLSLGIETLGSVCTVLIPRNTTIPTNKKETFSTAADNQTAVDIHVLQGERPLASDNRTLGRFQLAGIPSAPRGVPQVEVSFDIDANGILHVSAKDLGTGKEHSIKIQSSSGLSEEEIKKMQQEADVHAEEDKKNRELIDAKNSADQVVYSTENVLKEHGDKIDDAEKENINQALEKLKTAKEGQDLEGIKKATEELQAASHKLSQAMYEATAQKEQAAGAGEATEEQSSDEKDPKKDKDDGDVIDADYEVKD